MKWTKEYRKQWRRAYYLLNKERELRNATAWQKKLLSENPAEFRRRAKASYERNKSKYLIQKKQYNAKWRDKFFAHYGDVCVCCGEAEKTFLTIEHLNGDGRQHRERVRSMNRTAIFIDLERRGWPEEYTVLCFNCNHGKYMNRGTCPHVQKKVLKMLEEIGDQELIFETENK